MRRALLLVVAAWSAGCQGLLTQEGAPGCHVGTLSGEWTEPGLHAMLATAPDAEGAEVERLVPPEPRLVNATLQERWGPAVGFGELSYRPDGEGRHSRAELTRNPWLEGPLQLAVDVPAGTTREEAMGLASILLARVGVPEAEREAHLTRLADAWEPAPPGVANSLAATPFRAEVDWSGLPDLLFPNGTEELDAFSNLRALHEHPWRLVLLPERLRISGNVDGASMEITVAPDDLATLSAPRLDPSETAEDAFARADALLARLGIPPLDYEGFEGAVAIC